MIIKQDLTKKKQQPCVTAGLVVSPTLFDIVLWVMPVWISHAQNQRGGACNMGELVCAVSPTIHK